MTERTIYKKLAEAHYGETWTDGTIIYAQSFVNPGGVHIDDSMGRGAETAIPLGVRHERFWILEDDTMNEVDKTQYELYIKRIQYENKENN